MLSSGASSAAVMSRALGVITSAMRASRRDSKRMSRAVTMPTRSPESVPCEPLPRAATTGTPEMRCSRVSSIKSRTVASGRMVMGSRITPDSNFFTARTSRACFLSDMFL